MFSLAQLRRLGPPLLGLVLLAHVAGIVPLIGIYVQHAIENDQDVAADLVEGGSVNHVHHHHAHHDGGQHDHGTADPNDQCCTLHHHLAGVLLPIMGNVSLSGLTASIVVVPPRSLSGADPGTLERPPKPVLSI
jgi:hypothetical protein